MTANGILHLQQRPNSERNKVLRKFEAKVLAWAAISKAGSSEIFMKVAIR